MNLLIITEYFPPSPNAEITGGVESRAYYMANYLSKRNRVTVLSSWKKGEKREQIMNSFKVYRIGGHHEYSNYSGFFSRIKFAHAAYNFGIKLREIELVDAYNYTSYAPGYFIARKLKIPIVATYHETWIGRWVKNKGLITGVPYELYERLLVKLDYNRIISVSGFTKERLVMHGVDERKIDVVHNGVDLSFFSNIRAEREKFPSVCFVGRLVDTKNIGLLIKAISLAKKKLPNIRCKIIGKGPDEKSLRRLAKSMALDKNIDFLGFVEQHKRVAEIIKSCHIFCNPSSVEGFGITLIEAMALGIPYVCSDIKPFKEVTENGKGGLIFSAGDYKELSNKIIYLLTNSKLYEKKRKELPRLAKKFSWEILASEAEKVYRKAMAGEPF